MNREVERILREAEYNAIQEISYMEILRQEKERMENYVDGKKLPRVEYTISLEKQNRKLRIGMVVALIIIFLTFIIPDFWYISLALSFILGIVFFIPFSIWTLFRTDTDPVYDFWIGGIYKHENKDKR